MNDLRFDEIHTTFLNQWIVFFAMLQEVLLLRATPRWFSRRHPALTPQGSRRRPPDVPMVSTFSLTFFKIVKHRESSTRSLRHVFRHQLSPDFDPVSVWHSLYQSQTSSLGLCRQQGVQCVAQRSDEHGGLISSRWNIRHRLRFCVLQKLYVPLVHKSEVVLELEMGLQVKFSHRCRTELVLQQVSRLLQCSSPLNHCSAAMRSLFAYWFNEDLFQDLWYWNVYNFLNDALAWICPCVGQCRHVTTVQETTGKQSDDTLELRIPWS